MTGVLEPGTTGHDTTGDPRWTPLRVTAHLSEPVVGLAEQGAALDGPASWGAFVTARATGAHIPPVLPDWTPDFSLPIAIWTRPVPDGASADPRLLTTHADTWGWACSRAHYAASAHTAVDIRRRPAVNEMARFTSERRHHLGLGPHKARSVALPAVDARTVVWWALAEPGPLLALLEHVTHLGRHTRHGHGRVLGWEVQADPDARQRWQQRDMPATGGEPRGIRAPYWHPSRRMPCR